VAGLLGLWWWVTTMGWIPPLFLPLPPAVWQQLHDYALGQANDHSLWAHLGASLGRVLLAFALACLTAIPAGIAMGSSRWARGVLDPLLEFYRPLPPWPTCPLSSSGAASMSCPRCC
jgi:taurine transport system permease protein